MRSKTKKSYPSAFSVAAAGLQLVFVARRGGDIHRIFGEYVEQMHKQGLSGHGLQVCDCGESFMFAAPLVHCPVCAHHYPKHRGECGNCHRSFRGLSPMRVVPETEADEYLDRLYLHKQTEE